MCIWQSKKESPPQLTWMIPVEMPAKRTHSRRLGAYVGIRVGCFAGFSILSIFVYTVVPVDSIDTHISTYGTASAKSPHTHTSRSHPLLCDGRNSNIHPIWGSYLGMAFLYLLNTTGIRCGHRKTIFSNPARRSTLIHLPPCIPPYSFFVIF